MQAQNHTTEQVSQRKVENVIEVPVPQVMEEIVDVAKHVKFIPQDRAKNRAVEQIMVLSVPQTQDKILRDPARGCLDVRSTGTGVVSHRGATWICQCNGLRPTFHA